MDTQNWNMTVADCLQWLQETKYPAGFCCEACGNLAAYSVRGGRALECIGCGKQSSLTAGTLLQDLKTPLDKVFRLFYEIACGDIKSNSALSKKLELPFTTTWRLSHKVRCVIEATLPPQEAQAVHCSDLKRVLFKRSTESEPSIKLDDPKSASEKKQNLRDLVSTQPPESFKPEYIFRSVFEAMVFIAHFFQGISRKYCQRYLAQFHFQLRYHGNFPLLARSCIRAGPISDRQITEYASPEFVMLPLIDAA